MNSSVIVTIFYIKITLSYVNTVCLFFPFLSLRCTYLCCCCTRRLNMLHKINDLLIIKVGKIHDHDKKWN